MEDAGVSSISLRLDAGAIGRSVLVYDDSKVCRVTRGRKAISSGFKPSPYDHLLMQFLYLQACRVK